MNYKITFNPIVREDIQEAVVWYNRQQTGLGKKFYKELQSYVSILKKSAHCFAHRYDNIHCLPLRKFPFMIHYRVNTKINEVRIEAVLHSSLNPTKWKKRIYD